MTDTIYNYFKRFPTKYQQIKQSEKIEYLFDSFQHIFKLNKYQSLYKSLNATQIIIIFQEIEIIVYNIENGFY